jgi:hypothetical protein
MNLVLAAMLVLATNAVPSLLQAGSPGLDLASWITALATFALVLAAVIVAVCESRRHRFTQKTLSTSTEG